MKDSTQCCGFGGTFSIKYGDGLRRDRRREVAATSAPRGRRRRSRDLGCMLNIEGRLRRTGDETTRVLHVAQVLAGGTPRTGATDAGAVDALQVARGDEAPPTRGCRRTSAAFATSESPPARRRSLELEIFEGTRNAAVERPGNRPLAKPGSLARALGSAATPRGRDRCCTAQSTPRRRS